MWIGPVKFSSSNLNAGGASKLAAKIDALSQRNCDVSIVGKMARDAFHGNSSSATAENMIQNASVVWEFLKGRNLPGLLALDRVRILNHFNYNLEIKHTTLKRLSYKNCL